MSENYSISYLPILCRGLIVACVVGPTLTLINQTEALFGTAPFNLVSMCLTMVVPFLVSSVSSFLSQRSALKILREAQMHHRVALTEAQRKLDDAMQKSARLEKDLQHVETLHAGSQDAMHDALQQLKAEQSKVVPLPPSIPPPAECACAPQNEVDFERLETAQQLVAQIRNNAQNVNTASKERVVFIGQVLSRAGAVKAQVEQLGRKSNQTRESVVEVDRQVDCISNGIVGLCSDISDTMQPVRDMQGAAENVEQQFDKVKKSSSRLGTLATQIRLLSLNASVEAARAGPEGAGFKVVANEVRLLAESSKQDLTQIAEAMDALDAYMSDLSKLIDRAADSLASNDETASGCNTLVTEVCASIRSLGAQIVEFSNETELQLPHVTGLIEDIENIKQNTEAAVTGSANNIDLCCQTLTAMQDIVQAPDSHHGKTAEQRASR